MLYADPGVSPRVFVVLVFPENQGLRNHSFTVCAIFGPLIAYASGLSKTVALHILAGLKYDHRSYMLASARRSRTLHLIHSKSRDSISLYSTTIKSFQTTNQSQGSGHPTTIVPR